VEDALLVEKVSPSEASIPWRAEDDGACGSAAKTTLTQGSVNESNSVTEMNFVHQNGLSLYFGEPKTFIEPRDGTEGEKWKPSMGSEIMNFLNRKA
jgi:hypothetical protein